MGEFSDGVGAACRWQLLGSMGRMDWSATGESRAEVQEVHCGERAEVALRHGSAFQEGRPIRLLFSVLSSFIYRQL